MSFISDYHVSFCLPLLLFFPGVSFFVRVAMSFCYFTLAPEASSFLPGLLLYSVSLLLFNYPALVGRFLVKQVDPSINTRPFEVILTALFVLSLLSPASLEATLNLSVSTLDIEQYVKHGLRLLLTLSTPFVAALLAHDFIYLVTERLEVTVLPFRLTRVALAFVLMTYLLPLDFG